MPRKISNEEFWKRVQKRHGEKYQYLTQFNGLGEFLTIVCSEHGEFIQKGYVHIGGGGCQKCGYKYRHMPTKLSHNDFIKRAQSIHGNKYIYLSKYDSIFKPITIRCKEHGKFEQIACNHLQGNGCPTCCESKGEKFITRWLKTRDINFKCQYKFEDCIYKRKLPFDFYLIDKNICIEYQGHHHYMQNGEGSGFYNRSDFDLTRRRDLIKKQYCLKNNIRLIEIAYWDFNKIEEILERELNPNRFVFTFSYNKIQQAA